MKDAKSKGVNVSIFAPIDNINKEIMAYAKQIAKVNKIDIDLGRYVIVDGNDLFIFTENDAEVHPSNENCDGSFSMSLYIIFYFF